MKSNPIKLALLCLMTSSAFADEDTVKLDSTTVVAVANKQERPLLEVVGAVTVINANDIATTNSENIADVLRYESNISMENAGTRFGNSGINIRGIGQNRVAIEVDGITNAKQFSIGSYANATAQFPDTDLIKSIEILNGPASTLYGSDAIGGIVSIHTWNPEDLTRLSDNNRYSKLRLGYDGKTNGRVISVLSAMDTDKWGAVLGFTQRDGKALKTHDSSRLLRDFGDWDEQSVFAKVVLSTANSNTISFGFTGKQGDNSTQINSYIGQGRFSRSTQLSAKDSSDNVKFTLDYDFSLNSSWFDDGIIRAYGAQTQFDQNSFENRSSRRGTPLAQYRRFQFQQQNTGLELNLNKHYLFENSSHQLVYGLEYKSADVQEQRDGAETNLSTNITRPFILGESFPRRDFPNSKINEFGLYVMDEIKFSDTAWTLIPALRFDYYDLKPTRDALFDANGTSTEVVAITDSNISPKLGLMYSLNPDSNLYAQYVRGFRAPPFDDVNIGLNIPIFNIRAIANPDLKSETSDGFELGYRYFGESQQFQISSFFSLYNNFIESKVRIGVDPSSGTVLFQSQNIDEAKIYGLEMNHHWQINDSFSMFTTLAVSRGDNQSKDVPLNSISPAKLVHNMSWSSLNKRWNIDLYSSFIGKQDRVAEERHDLFSPAAYAVFDLIVDYQLSPKQNLRLGVFNLTDKKYWDWQQVRNLAADDILIDALAKPSRNYSFSYRLVF